jgi:translocation and assembly module TamB
MLFGTLLWFRKVLLYVLIGVILIGFLLYFALNSPLLIQTLAQKFASDYHITYSRIYGNAITGVEIDDLHFKNERLAKHLLLKWNPSALIKKEILVNTLIIEKIDVDGLKSLIEEFLSSDDQNESNSSFAFGIRIKDIRIDTDSFTEEGIEFRRAGLKLHDLRYDADLLSIEHMKLDVDSNITQLAAEGNIVDKILTIKHCSIDKLDSAAIEELSSRFTDNNTSDESQMTTSDQNSTLLIDGIKIKELMVDLLPRTYESIQVESVKLALKEGYVDIKKAMMKEAELFLSFKSDLALFNLDANVMENVLEGKVKIYPDEALFTTYDLPFRKDAISHITIDLKASRTEVLAELNTVVKQLLDTNDNAFNIDIETLSSKLIYKVSDSTMLVDTHVRVNAPYTQGLTIINVLNFDEDITYTGELTLPKISGIDANYTRPLENLHIDYEGNLQSLTSTLHSQNVQGTLHSSDFKVLDIQLQTREAIEVGSLVLLPTELNQTKANVFLDVPIQLDGNGSQQGTIKIRSNMIEVDSNVTYDQIVTFNSLISIPKESLLRPMNEAVQWDNLHPLKLDMILNENNLESSLNAGIIDIYAWYDLNTTIIDGHVKLNGFQTDINGSIQEQLHAQMQLKEIETFMNSVQTLYTLPKIPTIYGSAELTLDVDQLENFSLNFKAPWLVYEPEYNSQYFIDDVAFRLDMNRTNVLLSEYHLTYEGQKVFATKPSSLRLKDNILTLDTLWVNDALKVDGNYSFVNKQGSISTVASPLPISHDIVDLKSDIDIVTTLDGNKTFIKGKVTILDGKIKYDIANKKFDSDSDILIVQEMHEEEPSVFMDGLSTEIQIETKKPLTYKKDNINIKAGAEVTAHKVEGSDLMVLGTVKLYKGGSYTFRDKRFVLDDSFVYFTGNPNKPLLEITVNYKAIEHLITILITGTADMPNIIFSSKPALTKEQILSIILFDSEAGAGTNSGNDMMKMMGGAMAKSALNDLGVKIDHLVLGAGNSVEVGKKLTDDVTIRER